MRIISIRGENLASLAGTFEVDFDAGPLRDAGLFAIVGPTGSGKSTLLDALCLALFDRTPRLSGNRGHRLGRAEQDAEVMSNDVRNVVRHGCAHARAEVDFLGNDGRTYTARWEVKRARGKVDGRLQKQSLELYCKASGQKIAAGKKTEVLVEIKARVGLEFDQFRRSVLLAQGDFAAFLKASDKERAELLERMTGTEIYAAVSRQAHGRLSEEKKKLELLEAKRGSVPVLEDEERARSRSRQAELAEQRTRLVEELERRGGLVAGFEKAAELERSKAASEAAHRALSQELEAEVKKLGALEERLAQAAAGVAGARRALGEAEEPLKEARRLDELLGHNREAQTQWQKKLEETRAERGRLDEMIVSLVKRLETAGHRREELEMWRAGHPELVALEKETGRLVDLASGCAKQAERLKAARAEAVRAEEELGRLEAGLRDKKTQEENAGRTLEGCEQRVEEARGRAEEIDRDELRGARADAARSEQRLSRLIEVHGSVEGLAARRREKDRTLREEETRLKAAGVELERFSNEIPVMRAAKDEATLAWEDARAFLDLETEREKLEPGRPCPLCGALEHPWAKKSALEVHVDERRERVKELEERLSAAQQARARVQEQARRSEQELGGLKEELAALDSEIAQHEELFHALVQELPKPLPEDGVRLHLEGTRREIAGRIEKIDDLEAELSRREKRYRGLVEAAAEARNAREAVRREREKLERQTEALRGKKDVAASTQAQLQEELEKNRGALETALARHDGSIYSEDFAETASRLAKIAEDVRRVSEGIAAADKERISIEPDLAAARERASSLEKNESEALRELEELRQKVATTKKRRDELFGGRAADAVEEELRRRLAGAEEAEKEQRAAREALSLRVADKKGRLVTTAEQTKRLAEESARLLSELRVGCEGLGVPCEAEAVRAGREETASLLEEAREEAAQIDARLKSDGEARARIGALAQRIEEHREAMKVWEILDELIGSSDGAKFRKYAQSVTLDNLVAHANVHLAELSRRYRVERVPGDELELQVVDTEMGDEVRAASSLSGGETFLVSLALALGLASMASSRVAVESLFVDEGFGTLDAQTLDVALAALESLRASGRQVGVISHVPGLAEQLGARVEVTKIGPGRSSVRVLGAHDGAVAD